MDAASRYLSLCRELLRCSGQLAAAAREADWDRVEVLLGRRERVIADVRSLALPLGKLPPVQQEQARELLAAVQEGDREVKARLVQVLQERQSQLQELYRTHRGLRGYLEAVRSRPGARFLDQRK